MYFKFLFKTKKKKNVNNKSKTIFILSAIYRQLNVFNLECYNKLKTAATR